MKKILYMICLAVALAVSSCGSGEEAVNEQIAAAQEAIDAGEYADAQKILDSVVKRGLDGMTESNLGNLAVQYMRLADHSDNDDNIATAAECFREADRISTDSLKGFSSSLSPEDLAHFYLVRRIVSGIDNPVDLTAEEFTSEDSIYIDFAPADTLK